ncbi:MAG: FCD domain-containing protein [Tabrizicola sp.]
MTTRLAAQFHDEGDLVAIRAREEAFAKVVLAGDTNGMIQLNRDFHVAIAEAGRNPYYLQLSRAFWTRAGASCGCTITRPSNPACRTRIQEHEGDHRGHCGPGCRELRQAREGTRRQDRSADPGYDGAGFAAGNPAVNRQLSHQCLYTR